MHPSWDVLIKNLQSSVNKSPVVVSPQVALQTIFPFSISNIEMYLSVDAVIKNVPDQSRVTKEKSYPPWDFIFSGFFSNTQHLKLKSDTVNNLSCPATILVSTQSIETILLFLNTSLWYRESSFLFSSKFL